MPHSEIERHLEIKDPIHGYVTLTRLESSILDLRMAQRLRNIKSPAGVFLVYPGADSSLLSHMLGYMHVTGILFDSLEAEQDVIQKARLTAMFFALARGTWDNVMEEYLTVRGLGRREMAERILRGSPATDIIQNSTLSVEEISDCIRNGILVKDTRVDLQYFSISPELIDSLLRDARFAGVEYAKLEFRRLFDTTHVIKKRIAVERGALYTFESYLSAAANMFDAVYYHKTTRAAELMLLRILDTVGKEIMVFPSEDLSDFLLFDDITVCDILRKTPEGASEERRNVSTLFDTFRKRRLIKLASSRMISDRDFIKKISTQTDRQQLETEIAEAAGVDPWYVYIDFPDRASVAYYPGRLRLDKIALFERGSNGYEFWPVEEHSMLAKSICRGLMPIRVYTTKTYRTRVRREADALLESADTPGTL